MGVCVLDNTIWIGNEHDDLLIMVAFILHYDDFGPVLFTRLLSVLRSCHFYTVRPRPWTVD